MATNRLVWSGLEELRAQLRNLPDRLTGEASEIVESHANRAAAEIKAAYPVRTGNLRKNVFVTHVEKGRHFAGAIVKNTAPHAWLFENGTQARHNTLGANRGTMPPGHVFIPAVIRWRRRMFGDLKAMVTREGITVSGEL